MSWGCGDKINNMVAIQVGSSPARPAELVVCRFSGPFVNDAGWFHEQLVVIKQLRCGLRRRLAEQAKQYGKGN